ncbi:MAG: hypothetical protein D6729_03990 [Deltaproteobacteria bacterium]|nr:MAG: hypothetical protein D6729_03990 [Deltaproteobacteria bacterium]
MPAASGPEAAREAEAHFFSFEEEVAKAARAPRGAWRSPVLMAVLVALSAYTAWLLWPDVRYFFSPDTPIDLGADGAYDLSQARDGAFVEVAGLPSTLRAQFKQAFGRYKVYYLLGSHIFVREPLPESPPAKGGDAVGAYGYYRGRGRLVDLLHAREYRNIVRFYEERAGFDFSKGAWLVLDGATPKRYWPHVLGFGAAVVVGLVNLFLLLRRLPGNRRRTRRRAPPG